MVPRSHDQSQADDGSQPETGGCGGGTAGCGALCNCKDGKIQLIGDCTNGKAAPILKNYTCKNGYLYTKGGAKACQ